MNATIEDVAISTRIRLARNFENYPFPNRMHDRRQARDLIHSVAQCLELTDAFSLTYMDTMSDMAVSAMYERNLISRDVMKNKEIAAVLLANDESISVMINEEDHIREQCFMPGLELERVYERIVGIDEAIARINPFAYDRQLGYLTACPSNLGTGLRASVKMFLPAATQSGRISEFIPYLKANGLTVRGAFGEGTVVDGSFYQISNEVTLGLSEEEILAKVEETVMQIIDIEHEEREKIFNGNRLQFVDTVFRSYGILTNCVSLNLKEFMGLMTNIKLGMAMGIIEGDVALIDSIIQNMRPGTLNERSGDRLTEDMQNILRAEYTRELLVNNLKVSDGEQRADLITQLLSK